MKLVVGLGNPGSQYVRTRHNIGFRAVERIAERAGASFNRRQFEAEAAELQLAGERVLLLKPQTFMNLSGRSVGPAASFFKIPPADVLVIHDEVDLPPGAARFKRGGGSAGHNGLKSVTAAIGADFVRLRLGVGKAPHGGDTAAWVLGAFSRDEEPGVELQLDLAEAAVGQWVAHGIEPAMNDLHRRQK